MVFPYFGSKSKVVHLYSPPKHRLVIEPFAGSARYALLHCHEHDVWVNDIDPLIVAIWRFIKRATRKDIMSLPELKAGQRLDQFKQLSPVERDLIGFCMGFARIDPATTCTEWGERKRSCRLTKQRILDHQHFIRTWRITNWHYSRLPDIEATWFVDPPYEHARATYRYNAVNDYRRLARWCRSRPGQVMVCEGEGARWLPFRPLTRQYVGTGRPKFFTESVWTKG